MRVNQQDKPVIEETIFASWTKSEDPADLAAALQQLCEHLGVKIVRTNATKHGNTEMVLRKIED